ncbi:MAG: PDZ domain-containing protein [Verrucomicrobiales bacterium]|nr:PDZ domain-containing protein [Verrucomicrobiota bacterium JB025]
MKILTTSIVAVALLATAAFAQDDIPLLRPEERQAVDNQADQFNGALENSLSEAAKSTVRIWSGNRRLAYGTVVGDGSQIITKWSELVGAPRRIRVEAFDGQVRDVDPSGVFQDEDIVVLDLIGPPLTPVKWSDKSPKLGSFVTAPQPSGQPASFGVVSVLERSLRDSDHAFIGIVGAVGFDGSGVKIHEVTPKSGAAAAGLKPGDIILKVNNRPISGLLELKNSLVDVKPGDTVNLIVKSSNGESSVPVTLGNRPELPNYLGDRLRTMEGMGTDQSRVRDSFTNVIQSDMRPNPDQIGGPVVNLDGEVIGITMARATRTRSFIMPSAAVQNMLNSEPMDPALAAIPTEPSDQRIRIRPAVSPPRQFRPGSQQRLRRHLSEMQQLMDFMTQEMEALENGRW